MSDSDEDNSDIKKKLAEVSDEEDFSDNEKIKEEKSAQNAINNPEKEVQKNENKFEAQKQKEVPKKLIQSKKQKYSSESDDSSEKRKKEKEKKEIKEKNKDNKKDVQKKDRKENNKNDSEEDSEGIKKQLAEIDSDDESSPGKEKIKNKEVVKDSVNSPEKDTTKDIKNEPPKETEIPKKVIQSKKKEESSDSDSSEERKKQKEKKEKKQKDNQKDKKEDSKEKKPKKKKSSSSSSDSDSSRGDSSKKSKSIKKQEKFVKREEKIEDNKTVKKEEDKIDDKKISEKSSVSSINKENEKNYKNNNGRSSWNNRPNQNQNNNINQSYYNNSSKSTQQSSQINYERKKGKKYDLNEEKELKKIISENSEIIEEMKNAYPEANKLDCAKIYKKIKGNDSSNTIFEIMNKIHRDISIEITLNKTEESKTNLFQIDPYEIIDTFYNNPEHVSMMKYYKIYSFEDKEKLPSLLQKLPNNYFYDKNQEKGERRRKLIKYSDGSFNYIPSDCPKGKNCNLQNCPYSHNENENCYHSLYFKTIYNSNYKNIGKNKESKLFKDATNLFKDFRIIYNYKNENIINLMNLFEDKKISKYSFKEYMKNKITSFSLHTFKTIECSSVKSGLKCSKDAHLCYYYHNISERRRPPSLYCYTNEMCPYQKISNDKIKERCKNGDFCNKCHSRYEYNYHKLFFGKAMTCIRPKQKGKCIFEETCYGYHPYMEPGYKRTKEEILEEKKEEIITKNGNDFNLLSKLIEKYRCPKCKEFKKKLKYCLIIDCNHILCSKCFKKEKKCPICNNRFKKEKEGEDYIEIDFSSMSKDVDALVKKNYEKRKEEQQKKNEEEKNVEEKKDKGKKEDEDEKDEEKKIEKNNDNNDNENDPNLSM